MGTLSFSLVSLLLILGLACDQGNRGPASLPSDDTLGMEALLVDAIHNITVAQNICYAFKRKNILMRTNFQGEEFPFRLKQRDCTGPESSFVVSTRLSSGDGPMEFIPEKVEKAPPLPMPTVLTDKHGPLGDFCQAVFQNNEPSNSRWDQESGDMVQYILYEEGKDSFDGISLVYFRRNNPLSYKEVEIRVDLRGEIQGVRGLVYRFRRREECPEEGQEGKVKSVLQEYDSQS